MLLIITPGKSRMFFIIPITVKITISQTFNAFNISVSPSHFEWNRKLLPSDLEYSTMLLTSFCTDFCRKQSACTFLFPGLSQVTVSRDVKFSVQRTEHATANWFHALQACF
jgi:hypothetical protein